VLINVYLREIVNKHQLSALLLNTVLGATWVANGQAIPPESTGYFSITEFPSTIGCMRKV